MPEEAREVQDDELLAQLATHPAFQLLERLWTERRTSAANSLAGRLLAGDEMDQREVDKLAGRLDGGRELLNMPQHAAKRLDRRSVTAGG